MAISRQDPDRCEPSPRSVRAPAEQAISEVISPYATVLLAGERLDEARLVLQEAAELLERTDVIYLQADTLVLLAETETASGARTTSHDLRARALALYEAKGDLVSARRVRERSSSSAA